MTDNLLKTIYLSLNKQRKSIFFLIVFLFLFSIFHLFALPFDNNVELMLPSNVDFSRSLKFLRESNLSDKVVLSLILEGDDKTPDDLIEASEELRSTLKPPLIKKIEPGKEEIEGLNDLEEYLDYVPQIVAPADLTLIEEAITEKNIKTRLKESYKNMLSMNSIFLKGFVKRDPLNLKAKYLKQIGELATSLGYKVKFSKGALLSDDEKHALLILTTPILMTDSSVARKLIDYINERIAQLPDYVNVDIISGHLHTLSNEDVLKKDITRTAFAITVILLVLILTVLRSVRTVILFIVPVIAIIISMNITALTFGTLSSFVVGLSSVIVGIVVDYGIHIYLAVRAGGYEKIKDIAQPILVSMFTTMGVFASFFFSDINGYKQFALLTNLSIVISVFFYLFILPKFFAKAEERKTRHGTRLSKTTSVIRDSGIVFLWVVILGVLVVLSQKITFSNDMRNYDGSDKKIFDAETHFHDVWGVDEEKAMLVINGDTQDEVLKENEHLYLLMKEQFGDDAIVSLASVYPSSDTRKENARRWNAFWKEGRGDRVYNLIKTYGKNYGYAADAFNLFFDNLFIDGVENNNLKEPKILNQIKRRFLQKTEEGYYLISYFPDTESSVYKANEIIKKDSNKFIVSRKNMAKSITASVYQEVKKLSYVTVAFIITLTILLLRNIYLTLLALIPVGTSVLAVIGSYSFLGFSLNAPAIIAILVLVGLCIDYGVFMVYECEHRMGAGTMLAVTLSAVTTIAGGGVLLLAKHPVLFYVGLTMAIGVFSGYLSAIVVVPAFFRLGVRGRGAQ